MSDDLPAAWFDASDFAPLDSGPVPRVDYQRVPAGPAVLLAVVR